MKLHTQVFYRKPDGKFGQDGSTDDACLGVFVQSRYNDRFNHHVFSKRVLESKKGRPVSLIYFVPNPEEKLPKVEDTLRNALDRFTQKEGIPLGARMELARMGKFTEFINP